MCFDFTYFYLLFLLIRSRRFQFGSDKCVFIFILICWLSLSFISISIHSSYFFSVISLSLFQGARKAASTGMERLRRWVISKRGFAGLRNEPTKRDRARPIRSLTVLIWRVLKLPFCYMDRFSSVSVSFFPLTYLKHIVTDRKT